MHRSHMGLVEKKTEKNVKSPAIVEKTSGKEKDDATTEIDELEHHDEHSFADNAKVHPF